MDKVQESGEENLTEKVQENDEENLAEKVLQPRLSSCLIFS